MAWSSGKDSELSPRRSDASYMQNEIEPSFPSAAWNLSKNTDFFENFVKKFAFGELNLLEIFT